MLFSPVERRLASVSSPSPEAFRDGGANPQSGSRLTGGRLVLMVFGDGQGEGGGVDLKVESVGRLDGVAVALDRLGAVAADLHLGLHRATDLVGGFKAWARVGLPVQPAELA